MAERKNSVWAYRMVFVALATLVGLTQLLPLSPGPGGLPGPDVVLLMVFSWVIMRPNYLPILMIALVMLAADLLLMRPPGLWAALAVLGAEFLRGWHSVLRAASFLAEWLLVAGVVAAMTLANTIILSIFGVEQPGLGLIAIQMFFTVVCYPLVVILAGRAFGVRKIRAGDPERLGSRL